MIYSELLNIDKKSPWTKEFGLDDLSVKTLLFSASMDFVMGLDGAGIYFQLFPGRQEKSPKFCIGKEIDNMDAFPNLRDLKQVDVDYLVYDSENRTSTFEKVIKDLGDSKVEQLIYIPLLQGNNRFLGFMVLYSYKALEITKLHESLFRQFRDNVMWRLNLNREQRLRKDITEIQNLVANSNEHPIFAKDKDYRIVYANDAFLSNYPSDQRDKVIGYTTLESYNADEVEEFTAEDRQAFATGLTKTIEKISFPSGETRTLETTKKRFSTSSGVEYILGVSYDLTDKMTIIEQLSKRNAELDKFSNIASQDLRGPINSVLKLLEWTLEDLDADTNPDAIANIKQIQNKTSRVNTLLEDLFEYSAAGRDKHDAKTFSLRSFVMKVVPDISMPSDAKLAIVDTEVTLPQKPLEVILQCILQNAVQHSDASPLQLTVDTYKDKNNLVVSVADNGCGIDEQDHEVVFQLFETLAPQFEKAGSGKGLALARKIIESYGGSIKLFSQLGKGCKFELSWPMAAKR